MIFSEFFETLFSRFAQVCTRSLVCTRYVAVFFNWHIVLELTNHKICPVEFDKLLEMLGLLPIADS